MARASCLYSYDVENTDEGGYGGKGEVVVSVLPGVDAPGGATEVSFAVPEPQELSSTPLANPNIKHMLRADLKAPSPTHCQSRVCAFKWGTLNIMGDPFPIQGGAKTPIDHINPTSVAPSTSLQSFEYITLTSCAQRPRCPKNPHVVCTLSYTLSPCSRQLVASGSSVALLGNPVGATQKVKLSQ